MEGHSKEVNLWSNFLKLPSGLDEDLTVNKIVDVYGSELKRSLSN